MSKSKKPEVTWIVTMLGTKGYLIVIEGSDLDEKAEKVGKDVFKAKGTLIFRRAGVSPEAEDIEIIE